MLIANYVCSTFYPHGRANGWPDISWELRLHWKTWWIQVGSWFSHTGLYRSIALSLFLSLSMYLCMHMYIGKLSGAPVPWHLDLVRPYIYFWGIVIIYLSFPSYGSGHCQRVLDCVWRHRQGTHWCAVNLTTLIGRFKLLLNWACGGEIAFFF